MGTIHLGDASGIVYLIVSVPRLSTRLSTLDRYLSLSDNLCDAYSHAGPIRRRKRGFLRSSAKIVVKMERNAYKLAMKMGDGLDYVSGLVRGEDK
eukprot:1184878-Prorocentrum_minimum.AAC.1